MKFSQQIPSFDESLFDLYDFDFEEDNDEKQLFPEQKKKLFVAS